MLQQHIKKHFPHSPTPGQTALIEKLDHFFKSPLRVFVINGYAGTGKTTMISALVKALPHLKYKSVLLAPTGRAAKVITGYSGRQALTIHKKIYKKQDEEGFGSFELKMNLQQDTVFIVDEASMIGDATGDMNARNLLEDLFSYVFSGNNCRLILTGDVAQLPPVGMFVSPALNVKLLEREYGFPLDFYGLSDVIRQKEGSGILENATRLRTVVRQKEVTPPRFALNGFTDIIKLGGEEMEDALNSAYSKYGAENVIFICRSNKRANMYNGQIRARIRWQEEELSAGDLLMVVKNNYFWLAEESKAGFIANGDIIEVLKVKQIKEMYGFRFAHVLVKMLDYPDEPPLKTVLHLDTLAIEAPSFNTEQNKKLFDNVMQDYADIASKRNRFIKLKQNPYFNALQVKYAYAITCHKAQGGQWPCVFVDQGYLTREMINKEFMRWLYTAVTRATEKLYLVNFNDEFFEAGEE